MTSRAKRATKATKAPAPPAKKATAPKPAPRELTEAEKIGDGTRWWAEQ